jgi:methionyl-tRNA synthetase
MYKKYFNSEVVAGEGHEVYDDEIKALWDETLIEVERYMSTVEFSKALEAIFKFVSRMNKYIDETMPWSLAKSDEGKPRLAVVLKNLVEALNKIAVLVYPYIPESASKMWDQLGINKDIKLAQVEDIKAWDILETGHRLGEASPIFPRLEKPEVKVELEVDENLVIENPIEITDFEKVEMKVVEILEAEFAPDSKRIIKFKIETGSGIRQIISGIGKTYKKPEELVGRKVMAVLNLKPADIQGNLSQGMLLTTVEKKKTKLVFIDEAVKVASIIK